MGDAVAEILTEEEVKKRIANMKNKKKKFRQLSNE
jgi:hypothetical protein